MTNLPKHIIQQYGFYCTGTGYLALLLEKNFKNIKVLRTNKHEGPSSDMGDDYSEYKDILTEDTIQEGLTEEQVEELTQRTDIKYAIITKNPYAWLSSFIRKIKRSPKDDDFRLLYENGGMSTAYMLQLWTRANMRFYTFYTRNPDKIIFLRYENLLTNLEESLEGIRKKFLLTPKGKCKDLSEWAEDIYDKNTNKTSFDPAYYTEARYLEEYTEEDLRLIEPMLHPGLMKALGYEIL